MPTEADTCRKFVVPKLQAAGWDNEPHSIAEQRTFTNDHKLQFQDVVAHACVILTAYTAEKVLSLCVSPENLRPFWAESSKRADIIQQIAAPEIDFRTKAAQVGKPETALFVLQGHPHSNAPVAAHYQRADWRIRVEMVNAARRRLTCAATTTSKVRKYRAEQHISKRGFNGNGRKIP